MTENDEIQISISLEEAKKKTTEEKQDLQLELLYSVNHDVKKVKKCLWGNGEGLIMKVEKHTTIIDFLKSLIFWIITAIAGIGIAGFSIWARGGR